MDCHDTLYSIFLHLNNQKDRANASQVCRLWNLLMKETIPKFIQNWKNKFSYKITKIRFLVYKESLSDSTKSSEALITRLNNGSSPRLFLQIENGNKGFYTYLSLTKQNKRFFVYESDNDPPNWRLRILKWTIMMERNSQVVQLAHNTQIAPDDTNYCYFRTGDDYKMHENDIIIGSASQNVFCCCSIGLLAPFEDDENDNNL
mgnify:CR=1 FL=1